MVDFREPRPPGGGPKYTHASKERRGAAERKKNQERKSQESGKRYKRDLNTQAARGPANFINKVNNASYQSDDAALVQIVYQYITDTFWRYARCGKRQASWSLRSYVPLLEVAGQLVVSGCIFSYSVAVCALAAAP